MILISWGFKTKQMYWSLKIYQAIDLIHFLLKAHIYEEPYAFMRLSSGPP